MSDQDSYTSFISRFRKKHKSHTIKPPSALSYAEALSDETERLATMIEYRWRNMPDYSGALQTMCDDLGLQYIKANKAWASLGSELERMSHNLELSHYISYLQQAVQRVEDQDDKSRPEQHSLLWTARPGASVYSVAPVPLNRMTSRYQIPSLTSNLVSNTYTIGCEAPEGEGNPGQQPPRMVG